ncbi:glycerophosphodiester phosphodiesterase family protein [Bacillus solitudinis]|uniref:glycerophosphodiester phosphodiesterase family protein n=1 Tax=Bacillus solitudinis TaxID=2014074 RepID=UPI000C248E31|nr:glycerophosphodiester phosphodiesterase family protein [Bacillus solitudinis]
MMKNRTIYILLVLTIIFSSLNLNILSAYAVEKTRPSLDIKKTMDAPIMDGLIDESMWTVNEPLTVSFGEGGAGATFGMLWDQTYLYIAVDVEDDSLIHEGDGNWFQQDNISMFFDPTTHQSAPYLNNDMQIGFVYQPNTTTPEFHFGSALNNHASKNENDILRAIQTTDKGWSAEVAVPWEMLDFDPERVKELGFEINVTDRDDVIDAPFSAWSAHESSSFWNDTSGYGTIVLDEETVSGNVSDILLEEDFNQAEEGELPFGWTSHPNNGSNEFAIVNDDSGNGKLVFDGNAAGKAARALAPVQWDDYTVEADLTFEGVQNSARWAALMVRASANGANQYNQMAVRQNGAYEFAYRTPTNSWSVPLKGNWSQALILDEEYTLKIRVVGNHIKEYMKAKNDDEFTLVMDESLNHHLLERGKIGLQGDQSKVAFDNLKVTRVTADRIAMNVPEELEALSGAMPVSYQVQFSDGFNEAVQADEVKLYSSDESVIRIIDNEIHPLAAGSVTLKAIYRNAEVEKEITVNPSTTGVSVTSLQHEEGYLLASTKEQIELSNLTLNASFNNLTEGTIKGDELMWTANSDQVVISNNAITVTQKGIYELTAEKNGVSELIYLVVKDAAEAEYVLFEENFDSLEAIPASWTRVGLKTANAISIKNGALEIDGLADNYSSTGVLLPEYLGLFGNYKIEADLTHLQANTPSRWHSIMYRVQHNDFPYYQMAVRQGATAANGIEFAERTADSEWNVPEKTSFKEDIAANKMYHYTVKTHGNRVQNFINDELFINTDLATTYTKGRIGFQAAGSKMKIDNIKVSLQAKELSAMPPKPGENFVTVSEPDTGISMAPSIIHEVTTNEELEQLTEGELPATAILQVNRDLQVIDADNQSIASLETVLEEMDTKIIPAFAIDEEATIAPLITLLKSKDLEDAFVLSNQPDLVKKTREAYPIIRGVVDFSQITKLNEERLMDIRRTTNSNLAKIAILSEDEATIENISYLQRKLITVWVKEATDRQTTKVDLHKMITAGPNGMVIKDTNDVIDALSLYTNNTTLVRKPLMVGHRGIPGLAPENTLAGAKLAYEKGADIIENDIYLTTDGHIVVMHDGTIDRTTNGTGNVESYTLEQLKQFKANKQFPDEYPDEEIPTLREFFEEFKGKDVDHFVEIKSYKPEIIEKLVELIKEMGVEDQVSVISFNRNQIQLLGEKMPGMPAGLLTSGIASETDLYPSLREAIHITQNLNSTFNTSYSGLGENFMEAAKHRGLTFWPWTYRNTADFNKYFLLGTNGLTTDYNHWASEWAAQIKPEQASYILNGNKSVEIGATIDLYNRQTKEITPEIVILDGEDKLEVNGNTVTPKSAGTVHALLRYTQEIDSTNKYDIYTQPVTFTIKGNGKEKEKEKEKPKQPGKPNPTPKPKPEPKPSQVIVDNHAVRVERSTTEGGKTIVTTTVNKDRITEILEEQDEIERVTVNIEKEVGEVGEVKIPASIVKLLTEKNPQSLLEITSEEGTYRIPASEINITALATELEVDTDDVMISIMVNEVEDPDVIAQSTSEKFVSGFIEFKVLASAGDKELELDSFQSYVEREIALTMDVNPKHATVMKLEADGRYISIPTVFSEDVATFTSKSNGIFVIVER